jgi:uncharacterized membrane protein YuzA (DUF378 family)
MKWLNGLAAILTIVGGLNWGLVGLLKFDLVAAVFGGMQFGEVNVASRIVYALIGLSALYLTSQLRTFVGVLGMALLGAACSAVPARGAGSLEALARDPVATAASNTPELSTLVTAVKKAGLVDTLNSAQGITVFAPANDAFAALPKPTLDRPLGSQGPADHRAHLPRGPGPAHP